MDDPKLSSSAWWFTAAATALAVMYWRINDTPTLNVPGQAIAGFLALLSATFFFAGFFNFLNWLVYVAAIRHEEWRKSQAITPRLELMRQAAMLAPHQARLVPSLELQTDIGTTGGIDPHYFLLTEGGNIPLDWIQQYIKDCGAVRLKPIRTFPDETPGRQYATIFTDWCIQRGLATPAAGNNPAMWISEESRRNAARMIGIEI